MSGKNHICSVKTQIPPEHSLPVREKIHRNKHLFGTRWKSCVAYWPPFYTPNCSCSYKGLVLRKMLLREIWERFQLIEISTVWQPNLIISHAKSGWKEGRKRNDDRLSILFSLFPAVNFSRASHFRVFPTLSRLPHYRRAWNRLLSASLQSMASACTIFYETFIADQNCSITCGNCKTRRHDAFQEYSSLPVCSVFKQHCNEKVSIISQSYSLLLT